MSRYIDAGKIIYQWQIDPDGQEHDGVTLQSIINKMPSIDAVPVIRCKDCKHRPKGTGANHDLEFPDYVCPCQCEDYYYSWMPKDDWFCKDGERKEECTQ